MQGTARRIRRRQARRARGAPSPRRALALSGRAQREGRQGRPARSAHAVLDRQIRLPGARAGRADRSAACSTAREYRAVPPLRGFPLAVRCHMHFVTGRAEERLSFDIQREIAVRLGYTEHPGMQDVERFMKHYFLIAKDVGDLTAIVCAELEDRQAEARARCSTASSRGCARARAARAAATRRFHRRQEPHQRRRCRTSSSAIRST